MFSILYQFRKNIFSVPLSLKTRKFFNTYWAKSTVVTISSCFLSYLVEYCNCINWKIFTTFLEMYLWTYFQHIFKNQWSKKLKIKRCLLRNCDSISCNKAGLIASDYKRLRPKDSLNLFYRLGWLFFKCYNCYSRFIYDLCALKRSLLSFSLTRVWLLFSLVVSWF